mmetsp:Transcript_97543/g.232237  ORF Transcript_97543/g.232237 Transcript_97543/m.232237 type:complete len:186 (+) Transcript_97543:54-611(+)
MSYGETASSGFGMEADGKPLRSRSPVAIGGAPGASMASLGSMRSLTQSVLGDSKHDKALNALASAELLMKDLELASKERAVALQRHRRLQDQLGVMEKILGVDAATVDGHNALAAWRLLPGSINGFSIDADRVPAREAALEERESWVTSFAASLAGCPQKAERSEEPKADREILAVDEWQKVFAD